MKKIIGLFIGHSIYSNVLLLTGLLFGFILMSGLRKETFPEIELEKVSINVPYPGASPLEVEEGIVKPVENALEGISGIDKINATAIEHYASVIVDIKKGHDRDEVASDIRNAVDAINDFPTDAEQHITQLVSTKKPVIQLILYGNKSHFELKEEGEKLRNLLLAEKEISDVVLMGVPEPEIIIELREEELRRLNMTIVEVQEAVRKSNLNLSTGSLKTIDEEWRLRLYNRRYKAADLENFIVRQSPNGTTIKLRDIAQVIETWSEDNPTWMRFGKNNLPAVSLQINRSETEDTLTIRNALMSFIEKYRPSLKEGFQLTTWQDDSVTLRERINLLLKNGAQGIFLILIVLGVALNMRLSFWVAVGMVFAFTTAFAIIHFTNVTINVISLFGLIMVSGILVDDAIVIGENIFDKRQQGIPPMKAALNGTLEVFPAVFNSILTTVIAFCPFFFLDGRMGKFIWQMAATVIICLVLSLIESSFVLPVHLYHSLKSFNPASRQSPVRRFLDKIINFIIQKIFYLPAVWLLRRPVTVITGGCVIFMLFIAMIKGGHIKFIFFPKIDADYVVCLVEMEPGTPVLKRQESMERLQKAAVRAGESYREILGQSIIEEIQVNEGFKNMGEKASEYGEIIIKLLPGEKRVNRSGDRLSSAIFLKKWRQQSPTDKRILNIEYTSLRSHPFGKPLVLELTGPDLEKLAQASDYLKEKLQEEKGVLDINQVSNRGKNEVLFTVSPKGEALGLKPMDIARQVRATFYGDEIMRLQRGRDSVKVRVRYPQQDRSSFTSLHNMQIRLADGRRFPFNEVAKYDIRYGLARIKRKNSKRLFIIEADVDNALNNAEEIKKRFRADALPLLKNNFPQIQAVFAGQAEEQAKVNLSIRKYFSIALFFMFIVLSLMFRSFSHSFLVMLMIPFGLVGTLAGHWIFGQSMTILSFIGIIGLSGVVVNDSVVLLDSIVRYRNQGKTIRKAAILGMKNRIRPVLLTSITTSVSLMPIIFEKSLQAQFLIPVAITISIGLIGVTFYTLFFFPACYILLEPLREKMLSAYDWLYGHPESSDQVEENRDAR